MKERLFEDLLKSVKEAGAILRKEAKPSRSFRYSEPDVRAIRNRLGLSQNRFSLLLGISPATLRNWEQKRRKPVGAARILLRVADRHPELVLQSAFELQPGS